MKRRTLMKLLVRSTRAIFAFTSIFAMAVSPFMNALTPYLQADLAQRLEVNTAQAVTYAAADVVVYINAMQGTLSGLQYSGNWTVPGDWNTASNSIQVIGAGGGGGDAANANNGAGGGGGGGYSRINNLTFAAASTSIPFSVGASGSGGASTKGGKGGNTWFGKTAYATCFSAGTGVCVSAEGGEGGVYTNAVNGAGGLGGNTASASGTVKYAGGNGGAGSTTDGSGGGGGSAGPCGTGKAGGTATAATGGAGGGGAGGTCSSTGSTAGSNSTTTAGVAGGAGYNAGAGGAGGTPGGAGVNVGSGGGGGNPAAGGFGGKGNSGTEWDATHGSGGGGGGAGDGSTGAGGGGQGGKYGGGGGGAQSNTAALYGRGGQGLIVIKYRPILDLTPTAIGTQNATVDVPVASTSTYIGGAFKLSTTQTTTITSISITASTSTGDNTGIGDPKLYWDTAASCNTANPLALNLFNTASATFSGMKWTISGSKSITGTTAGTPGVAGAPTCFYPVFDIGPNAVVGNRMDVKIEAAGDITSSVTTPTGTYPVEISGVSTLSTPAATISVSGTCTLANGSTSCTDAGANNKVRLAVDGVLQSQVQETIGATWTISSVTKPSANAIVTVFLEGEAASSSQAAAVTKYNGSGDISAVQLMQAHLVVGSNQGNTITNANIALYDSSVSGKQTFYDVNGTTLTVDVDNKVTADSLYIAAGNVYQPNAAGGDTITAGSVEIMGSLTADGATAITSSGSWDSNGTFTAGTSTVTMTKTGTLDGHGTNTFNNLTINSSGTVTASGSFTVGGTLTSTAGTLSIPSGAVITHSGSSLTLSGTISGAGTLKETASGFTFPTGGTISSILRMDTTNGNQTLSARTYGGAVNIDNSGATNGRTVSLGAGTHTYSGAVTVLSSGTGSVELTGATSNPTVNVTGDITFTAGGGTKTITTGSGIWTAAGNVNLTNGTFTASAGNKLVMSGAAKTLTSNAQTLRNVTLSGSITLANATHTINGNLDLTGSTITAGTSTIVMSSISAALIGGAQTLANLTINPSSTGTITLGTSNLTVSGQVVVAAGDTFALGASRRLTLSGSGTPLLLYSTSVLSADAASTVVYSGTSATTIAPATYASLSFTPAGTVTYTLASASGQTITTNGNFLMGNGTNAVTVTAATRNPILDIRGDFTIAANAIYASGSATTLFKRGGGSGGGGIAIDASSPALVSDVDLDVVTATFTPPDSSLLVACVMANGGASDTSIILSNTGAPLVWTPRVERTYSESGTPGYAGLWTAPLVTGRSLTVAATKCISGLDDGIGMKVYVITGHDITTPTGAVAEGNSSSNVTTPSYTSTANGSRGIACAGDWNALGSATSTDQYESWSTALYDGIAVNKASNTATAGSTVDLNVDGFGTGGPLWNWVALEIDPSAAAAGSQTLTDNTTAKQNLGEIRISANSTATTLDLGSSIRVASVTIDASQTLNVHGTNTMTINGAGAVFTNTGNFLASTGTVQYTGATANIAPTTYEHLTLGGVGVYTLPSTGTTTLLGNMLVTSGARVASGSSTLFFRAGGTQSITDNNTTSVNLGEIAVKASTGGNTTLTLGSSVRIASATIDASQTLDANGANTLTITGIASPLTVNGTFAPSTGTVTFVGPGSTNIPALNYYDLKIQPSANNVTHTFLGGTASVSNTFIVGNGTNTGVTVTAATNASGLDVGNVSIAANTTLVANASQQFTVGHDWINNGSFTHSSGTVTFDFANTSSISGTTTFNNFISIIPGKKLKFNAGQTFTFAGTFTIAGSVGTPSRIESTASGSQWLVLFNNPQSAISYASFMDCGCAGGSSNVADFLTGMVDWGNNGNCWFRRALPPGVIGGGYTDGGSSGGGVFYGGGGEGAVAPPVDNGGSGGGGQQGGGGEGGGGGGTP